MNEILSILHVFESIYPRDFCNTRYMILILLKMRAQEVKMCQIPCEFDPDWYVKHT